MESPLGLWLQFEAHRLSEAIPDDFSIKVPEGVIRVVRCPNGEHVGRIEWAGDYGERDFIRGTWDHVVLAACEQVLRGVSVSPQYRPSKEPELVRDRLHFKMNLPDGELRILQFFNLYLGVLIPQDGLRILAWADNLDDALLGSRHAIAPRETFRMALRIGGMRRELRVSSTPGVLAYCDVFDETFIVVPEAPFLRDKALNLWDAPAAVWRVRDSEPVGCVARFGSLMELDGNDILWIDYEHNTAPEGPPARSSEPRPAAPLQPGSRSHGNDHAQMSRDSETNQARAAEVRQSPRIEHSPTNTASATDRAEQERARVTALLMQPRSAMPTSTEQLYADAVARIERAASAASRPVDTARPTGPTGRPGGPTGE